MKNTVVKLTPQQLRNQAKEWAEQRERREKMDRAHYLQMSALRTVEQRKPTRACAVRPPKRL